MANQKLVQGAAAVLAGFFLLGVVFFVAASIGAAMIGGAWWMLQSAGFVQQGPTVFGCYALSIAMAVVRSVFSGGLRVKVN